ncbi:WD40 repeat domain-containing serine/threonine protein kinase [Nocardia sp. NPDC057668]|uniref:WD40 repeat domain-containing serine/threonine protein kinase n=1 Tax=Nocardia sp. NPDC057668 TaxID=3346202 RepID=UPI00366EF4BA
MFAGYAIERPLGAGGMGVVYLARHPRLQRSVALKVLNDAFAHDAKARARFEREAALITALDHPNIVPIYDRNSPDDEILWISMKFVEGGDAASVLAHAGGRVTPERAVRMIGDAGRALDHAHRHGVLHRDVKPANLLVEHGAGTFERTMVTDFGIARSVEDSETGSRVSATLAYTAPERFGGGPVDHRADLYSLGCTLFKLLTGEPPFARSDDAAVIAAHLHAPLPRLTDVRPGLPGGLDEVLATVLAKNPHDRYPDCESFAAAARAAVDRSGETVVARHLPDHTPSTPRRLWLGEDAETAPAPRLPSIPAASEHDSTRDTGTHATSASGRTDSAADPGPPHAGGSFSPVAEQKSAGTAGIHPDPRPGGHGDDAGDATASERARPAARRAYTQPDSGDGGLFPGGASAEFAGDGHFAGGSATDRPSPRGASVGSAGGGHSAGSTAAGRTAPRGVLTRRRVLLGGVALALGAGGAAAGYAVFGSRGGDSASDGSNPVAAGGAEALAVPSQVLALAFTPDGSVLATGCKNNSTLLWNVETRQVDGSPLLGHSNSIRGVAFSPDGSQLLTGSEDGSARLWNAGTRQPIGNALTGHTSALRGVAFHPGGALMATGSDDGTAQVWTVNTRQPAGAPLTGHTGSVRALAFHPAGRLLATGSADGTARLWLVGTGTLSREPLTGHNGSIRTLACSPDGALLATAGDDAVIRLWDIVSRELSGDPLAGHAEPVLAIAFTADGSLLASGSRDGTVRLWNTKTRQPLGNPLTGHTASVHTLAFTPDGAVLATGSADGKVFLWKVADHR